MMPQGWRAARSIWAAFNPRPARSGPKPPSPLRPWQSLQSVNLGASLSQYAFPAAASPAGWAQAVCASGSIRIAINIFFMVSSLEGGDMQTYPATVTAIYTSANDRRTKPPGPAAHRLRQQAGAEARLGGGEP